MIRHFPTILLSIFLFFKSTAQIDTSFWFVAPKVPSAIGVNSVSLQFGSYSQTVAVAIRQPANTSGFNLSFTLAALSSTVIDLTPYQAVISSTQANVPDNKGLYISSTDLISSNYIIQSNVGQESISLKGQNGSGTEFFIPFPTNLNSLSTGTAVNTAFDIVASQSGTTTLLITPKGNLAGPHNKGITFVKTLTQGQTFSCQEILRGKNPAGVVAKDFNNDLSVDIAIIDQQNSLMFIFINNGAGLFTEVGNYALGIIPSKIIAADIDSDNNQDLIICNSATNDIYVFRGNGNGTFQSSINFSSPGSKPVSLACADINADSFLDLIVVNYASDNVSLFTGNNTGNFSFLSSYATYSLATQPTDVIVSDFNNDSYPDLAITNSFLNSVSILLTNTTTPGTFFPPVKYTVGTQPSALTAADFNSDGSMDLAIANRGSNNVSILKGSITGTFSAATNYGVGSAPVSIITTTINAGTSKDLAVANYGSNNFSVLLGNASGTTATFGGAVNVGVGTNPAYIAFADFNGDSKQDFVTANYTSGNYSACFGTTNTPGTATTTIYGTNLPSLLAGSIVSADQKINVTLSGAVQKPTACSSFYTDQITNQSFIGTDYVIPQSAPNDFVYILSPLNSTGLTISSSTVTNWLINSGETYTVNTFGSPLTYVKSDKPVYLFSMAGNGCKYGGAQIAPAYCAGSYTAGFARESGDSLFLQIYTRNGFQNTFTLVINGVPSSISVSNFAIVPGTASNLVGARIYYSTAMIPAGSYCILKNSADIFGLSIQYGSNSTGFAYSHMSNFATNPFVIANPISTATICSNTQFTLNGLIGGGPITGAWSTTGFGSFSGGINTLTNNIYVPNAVDTNIVPVKIILTSTGICPNKMDTLRLTVKQGPIVTAGSGEVICSNNPTVQLSGNVYGATNQGIWTVGAPGNGTFTPSANSFTPTYLLSNQDTSQAMLKFILTSANNGGCNPVTDTLRVIINKAPIVTASAVNPLIRCSNNSTVFLSGVVSGTTTSTGRWLTTGTGLFIPNNLSLICNYLPSPADLTAGSVYLSLESTNNIFCKPVRDSVKVIFTQPSAANAGIDINSCRNNAMAALNAVITGTATSSGIWYGGNGTYLPSNTALTNTYYATPAEAAAGFVVLSFSTTNNGLCLGSADQLKITFQDKPTANFTVNSVCLNLPTLFTDQSLNTSGLGSLTGWYWDLGDGSTITNTINPVYTYSLPGTYIAQLIVKNTFDCFDTAQRQVTVYGVPTASMLVSRSCSGSAQLITFTDESSIPLPDVIPASGYYWDFGGQGFSEAKDTAIVFPSEGIYGVTHIITTANNCKSVVTQSVNITPKPKARFKIVNNSALSLGANVSFLDSSNIVPSSWSWQLGDGETSTIKNPSITYTTNGTYTVSETISDQFGCTDTYTATLDINSIAGAINELIPNIITPNGDGKNDVWRLDFIGVFFPTAEVEIYSRWGERLFKSVGYADAWNGSYKGDPMPVGAYYYVIKLNDRENQIFKGTITLLK